MWRNVTRTLCAALLALGLVAVRPVGADEVQSQQQISERVAAAKPSERAYVKDQPILGWRLEGATLADLPGFVRENLGSMDATGYDDAYVARNRGSIVALQMTGEGPDFYIIGKSTYDDSYRQVPLDEVEAKNPKLVERLAMLPELLASFREQDSNLVGALKTEPVRMIRTSDIGYDISETVTIAAPWGPQTKPAGQDAFLVHDATKDEYYMINADADGSPIGYVPAD